MGRGVDFSIFFSHPKCAFYHQVSKIQSFWDTLHVFDAENSLHRITPHTTKTRYPIINDWSDVLKGRLRERTNVFVAGRTNRIKNRSFNRVSRLHVNTVREQRRDWISRVDSRKYNQKKKNFSFRLTTEPISDGYAF